MMNSDTTGVVIPVPITDARLVACNVNESDYLVWSEGDTYGLGERRRVDNVDAHYVYESIQAGNTGNVPVGNSADLWWVLVSQTNKRLMFDGSLSSQTVFLDLIDVTIRPGSRVDAIGLLNVNATSARVRVIDPIDGTVYDVTTSLVSTSGIQDWYAYFMEPIVRSDSLVLTDLPPYSSADVRVELVAEGETVKCGACVVGASMELGLPQYGAKAGIQDYSQKTQDDFGNYNITKRAFNKYSDLVLFVENTLIDRIQQILAEFRATPILYVGSGRYSSLVIYGFYSDFSIVVDRPTTSLCNLSLKGLT